MSLSYASRPAIPTSIGDGCMLALAVLLAGYAVAGRTFAYLGIAPLYVGEMAFGLGIVALAYSRCAIATFAALPNIFLGLLMGWTVIRTLPYIGEFGIDALRDSVIVIYGGFAFIVTALLLEKPTRLTRVIIFLRALSIVLVPLAPFLLLLSDEALDRSGEASLVLIKAGTMAVHLSGAAILALLGFKRVSIVWLILLLVGMASASTQGRGGMLAAMAMITFAAIASGKQRQLGAVVTIAIGLIAVAYIADLSIPTNRSRDISARQLVDNVLSLFGSSDASLDGTKVWRMNWWGSIIDYTFNGPYFWAGKGFGVNLAVADGFLVGLEFPNAPWLRSPHNSHLAILARTGVPGFALWLLTVVSWSAVLLANMVRARRRGDDAWANFFVLIFCYALGFLIDATFDVALEGPMAGIWFWCLFGAGTAATMIYRASVPGELESRRGWQTNRHATGSA